jgi:hypothetical protein
MDDVIGPGGRTKRHDHDRHGPRNDMKFGVGWACPEASEL